VLEAATTPRKRAAAAALADVKRSLDIDSDSLQSYYIKAVALARQALDELRKRIGVKIEDTVEPWCYEATRDNIRHYAHGIGDDNPLWCVPEYARKTKFGDVIALPSFLFTTSRIISTARSMALCAPTLWCSWTASAIWSPTV